MFQMVPSWQQIQSQVWSMSQRCAGLAHPGARQVWSRALTNASWAAVGRYPVAVDQAGDGFAGGGAEDAFGHGGAVVVEDLEVPGGGGGQLGGGLAGDVGDDRPVAG